MERNELKLTHHFIDNWRLRVGGEPAAGAVQQIIRTSVRVQKAMWVVRDREPWLLLEIWWHPGLDLVIKLDPYENVAVTVMSRDCWRYDGQPAAADKPEPDGRPAETPARREVVPMRREKSRELTERALKISERYSGTRGAAR